MAKVEIEFEITGLKLKIKGERDDAAQALSALQRQVAGMMQLGAALPETNTPVPSSEGKLIETPSEPVSGNARAVGKRGGRGGRSDRPTASALQFRHEAAKYGNPQQGWGNTDKMMWLMFVLQDGGVAQEVSGPQLAATFTYHFKGAGAVRPSHTTRELGRAKMRNPALVGEDIED